LLGVGGHVGVSVAVEPFVTHQGVTSTPNRTSRKLFSRPLPHPHTAQS
jgi:hypothetical protein